MTMLIDSHCHLQFAQFNDDRAQVLDRAWQAGLSAIVVVGTDADASQRALDLAEAHPNVFAAVGWHPHQAAQFDDEQHLALRRLAESPKTVALGEIGLDFYRRLSPPETQRAVFQQLLDLAGELRLPVVVHSRAAEDEVFAILSGWAAQVKGQWPQERPLGIVHCFGGDLALALRYIQLGFLVSIAANVTYPNAGRLASVVAGLPLERLLVETDAPYLTPQSMRPQRNEPSFLVETVGRIAEIRAQTVREVAEQTSANAAALYGIAQVDASESADERETL
ncbi:MAG: TatD family hydrolase [Dehalococcoidia bacterium]|nr:MAG: TatD family hydrolase [Dehalococcoidia bacterium]